MDVDTIHINLAKPVDAVKLYLVYQMDRLRLDSVLDGFVSGQLVDFSMVCITISAVTNKILML